jgi:hypothetical protein
MGAVLNQLIGKTTFGTNWKTFPRKYPVARVTEEYVIIYDAAQK